MSDDTTPDDFQPTSLKTDLLSLDTIFDDTRRRRERVANQLGDLVATLSIDPAKPRETEVQMQIINTYLATLKSNEDNAKTRVGSKLKQLETETASKHSAAVAELLAKVTVGQLANPAIIPPTLSQRDSAIEHAFADAQLTPVQDSELKMDPADLT